ncbi:MAG: hypothetical protein WCF20_04965 [Methylovirgula sp.]
MPLVMPTGGGAASFVFFGFLISRLLRFCPFAMTALLCTGSIDAVRKQKAPRPSSGAGPWASDAMGAKRPARLYFQDLKYVLYRKSLSTFPGHALAPSTASNKAASPSVVGFIEAMSHVGRLRAADTALRPEL